MLLTILAQFGIGLPHIFFSKESIIFYLIGGFIGKHCFNKFTQKRNAKASGWALLAFILSLAYSTLCLFYPILKQPFVSVINLSIMGFAFWVICDLFIEKMPQKRFFQNSFFVFAMHKNLMEVIAKLLYFALPNSYLWALPNFIFTTILTLAVIEIFCILLRKYLPFAYRILSGERNARAPSSTYRG